MDKSKKQDLNLIFQALRDGNTNKLDELYEKYNKIIYGIAYSILKNKEDSEDIVQTIFTKIYQMDKDKLPTKNEASWLYSLTKNETLNYLRGKKQELDLDDIYYLADEDKELNSIIDNDSYNRIISKLDKQEQEIVSLKILSNMSFKEISQLLNIPIGTVQWKYYTSLYTLRLLLGNISMVIIGILLFVKENFTKQKQEETNIGNDIIIDSGTVEEGQSETETALSVENANTEQSGSEVTSSIENTFNSLESSDNVVQNEIMEIPEPQISQTNYQNTGYNIGILSFTGIFLFFSIIFTIIFVKHQQKAHKNVSK